MDMDDVARVLDEDRAAGDAGRGRGPRRRATRRRSSSPRARPASRAASSTRSATCAGQRLQAEHWFGAARGRARLVHDGAGLVEVDPQRLRRPLADAAPSAVLHDGRFDPDERLDLCRGARRQRPLPGADRVPDARQARRAARRSPPCAAWSPPASRSSPEVIRRLPRAPRARRSADGYGQTETGAISRHAAPARTIPRATARWAGRCPGIETRDRRRRAAAPRRLLPHLLRPLPRRRALRGRVVADRRPGPRGRGRLPLVRGPQRRPDPLLRLPDRPLRGRVGAASPTRPSPRPPRSPPPTPSAAPSSARSSSSATASRSRGARRASCRSTSSADRPLQVPADRRVRRRAAEDDQRQDQAGGAAPQG